MTCIVKTYKENNDINGTEWLAQFQDMNILENVWILVKTKDRKNPMP